MAAAAALKVIKGDWQATYLPNLTRMAGVDRSEKCDPFRSTISMAVKIRSLGRRSRSVYRLSQPVHCRIRPT